MSESDDSGVIFSSRARGSGQLCPEYSPLPAEEDYPAQCTPSYLRRRLPCPVCSSSSRREDYPAQSTPPLRGERNPQERLLGYSLCHNEEKAGMRRYSPGLTPVSLLVYPFHCWSSHKWLQVYPCATHGCTQRSCQTRKEEAQPDTRFTVGQFLEDRGGGVVPPT